jgi:hypothetical protein
VDSKLRVKLASAARNIIEQQFDIHHNALQMRKFFAACCERRLSSLPMSEMV